LQRDKFVFVLGAGASYSENAPLTNELLYKTLTQLNNDEMVDDLKEFLSDFFQINVDHPIKNRLPTFEEALTMVDIALERQDNFSANLSSERLNTIRDSLIYSIATVIDKALGDRGRYHDPFINSIYDLDKSLYKNVSFLNLNYDLLLDNALVRLYKTKDLDIDYGIDFRNFVRHKKRNESERDDFIKHADDWQIPRKGKSVLLLKPHGSLNWLYCPTCNTIFTTKTEKGTFRVYRKKEKCKNDGSFQRILIVPPTWGNYYENSFLMEISAKADKILRKAKKVFFIGCSLSDYDIKLKYLFKRALYTPLTQTKPQIVVIQDKKETPKDENDIKDRYCRFFGDNVLFEFNGFEDFSAHAQEFLKD
jgi:hypothetical protein